MILLIAAILITLYIVYQVYSRIQQVNTKECPPIIDPKTLERKDVLTKEGEEVLHRYMVHYLNKYINDTKDDWNYILPAQLKELDKTDLFLLDVRKPEDYKKGHIPGSTNIFWLNLLEPENLKKVPKDKQIVIICYVGHTASQILVLLKLLGYKAMVLKFGMGISPTKGIPVAGWYNMGYPVEKN